MQNLPIVIDNGSSTCKAGVAGEDSPRLVIPSLINPKEETISPVRPSRFKYLIENGVIRDVDEMQKIWNRIFEELQKFPVDNPILLTETLMNPKTIREKVIQIMFENFNAQRTFIASQPILALYAAGRTTGIILDCGEGTTFAVPAYEGYSLPASVLRQDLSGHSITSYLQKILTEREYDLSTIPYAIKKDIKEKAFYVALDFEQEMENALNYPFTIEKTYHLPDGKEITLGNERFRGPEALFRPHFIGYESAGVHEMIYNAIMKTDSDIRSNLFGNVVLSGGSTLFPGFVDRLQKELSELTSKCQVKVIATPERKFAPWIGGSILASLESFQPSFITKGEYEETGPTIVHRKCYI